MDAHLTLFAFAGAVAAGLIVASWLTLAVAHLRSLRERACPDDALRDAGQGPD